MNKSERIRHDRMPCVAGRFYPAVRETLVEELEVLFSSVGETIKYSNVRAIISPHAGYVYSGIVAASAFAAVPPHHVYDNIVLIGSSHRVSFNGASVYNAGDYYTPLGKVKVNREIADKLISDSGYFSYKPEAHLNEHCLEVQLPFIQHYFKKQPQIIPVIIGTSEIKSIREISRSLQPLFSSGNLFIVSTDFSHFPGYSDAQEVDAETAGAILTGSPEKLIEVLRKYKEKPVDGLATSMCGWSAGLTLMYLTQAEPDLEYKHLMYRNSGDTRHGDRNSVVGYHSFVIKEKSDKPADGVLINKAEARMLVSIARKAIESALGSGNDIPDSGSLPEALRKPSGAFVSLHLDDQLRGCIGRISSNEPLCDLVAKMAYAAAFSDPRFPPLSLEEYKKTKLEISVLSPMSKISDINDIIIGTHGIYIRRGGNSGVMLPQVAKERGWSVTQFLEHTAEGKAGIGKEGWKDAEIFIFRAQIIDDNDQEII